MKNIVTCIESIFTLSNKGIQKQQMIIDFYENYIEEEDKKLIQDNILVLNRVDEFSCLKNIMIEQFALLLISIRNTVAHEGIYWNLSFKGELEGDPNMVNVINQN